MAVFGLTQIASAGLCVLWSTKYLRYLAPYFGGYSEDGARRRGFLNLQICHVNFSAELIGRISWHRRWCCFWPTALLLPLWRSVAIANVPKLATADSLPKLRFR